MIPLLSSLALCLVLLLVGTGSLTEAAPAQAVPNTWQKGVTLQSRWADDFGGSASDGAIEQAKQANSNHVTLIIPLQQDNSYSTNIYKASFAPTDAALAHAITKAHSLGMQVTFKIHLDPNDGQWRAYINPDDRDTWFRNYSNWLYYCASLAQQNRVEQLIIGAELVSMSTATSNPDNTQRWRSMIAQVRQRFSGKLTYSANWGGCYFCEEFTHISFWDALDYIGISAYFELANYDNPSVSAIMDSWDWWNTNKIQPFQQSLGKPVLFTEIGYRSVDGAASQPWNWEKSGNYNPQEQSNGLDALMQYWSKYPWFAGMQYWAWKTDPNCCGAGNTDYEVQNKPGYNTMQSGFNSGTNTSSVSFSLVNASANPVSGPPGSNFSLQASIKASAAASALVDMEVYDAGGNKVYQQFADNQSFSAGQTRSFNFNWASPSNQTSGQYTLSVGVFTSDWRTNYAWSGNAASFNLSSGVNPTPTSTPGLTPTPTPPAGSYTLSVWWPANGVSVSGVQPFKARLENLDLGQYSMYWQVDGGQLNLMSDNSTDGPHKEASVNISGWNWRGSGPYTINFVAKDSGGRILQQQAIQIYVQS
jgi:hypothetical protein